MSNVSIKGNAAGTGNFTIESPNSNVSRNLILPDASTTLVGTDNTQTLSNKTITGSIIEGGGITLMEEKLASAGGTTNNFINIPAWVKRITITFVGVSVSGTELINIQLGTASAFENTGYSGMAIVTTAGGNAATALSSSFQLYDNTPTAAMLLSGSVVINRTGLSNRWVATGFVGPDTGTRFRNLAGSKTLSGELTRIRIATGGTNTFDAGFLNVMYEG